MRFKVNFKGNKGLLIPFNYNHAFASIIYNRIADLELAEDLHNRNGFKFFTFSQVDIPNHRKHRNGIIAYDGCFNLIISSPNDVLVNSLVEGFVNKPEIVFKGESVSVDSVEILPEPVFNDEMVFGTLSPILVREQTFDDEGKRVKTWDLPPSTDLFYHKLENNILKKYNAFNNYHYEGDVYINSDLHYCKGKHITITTQGNAIHNRCYLMDLRVCGHPDLLKFIYDCGAGEKNSMGFGMLKILGN